jgi:thiosulfate/3-mercaptopyruvate sulfurtransferase
MGRSSSRSSSALISADELHNELHRVRIIDFRWYLDDAAKGRREYEIGHIPAAVFVDLEDVTGEGPGRHPLPTRSQFQGAMRRAGVIRDARVVVYDDAGGSVAARLWWLLRAFGHPNVSVLDGGIQAWEGVLETGTVEKPLGDFVASEPDLSSVVTYEEVLGGFEDAVVLDVRAGERYRGEVEPVDPIAGHVPGAKNAFWQEFVMDAGGSGGSPPGQGKIASPDELRARFGKLGVGEGNAVVYCGSGVVASQTVLALEEAGLAPVRIYAGGWSDWSNRPGAPVATGDE